MSDPCPFDHCDGLLDYLPSIHMKMCMQCCSYFEWNLKEGQKSVTLSNYVKGRDDVMHSIGPRRVKSDPAKKKRLQQEGSDEGQHRDAWCNKIPTAGNRATGSSEYSTGSELKFTSEEV